jgi:mono/diheme cytochrome c family protein
MARVGFALAMAAALAGGTMIAADAKPFNDEQAANLFATTCGWCHENGGRVAGKGPKLAGTKRSDAFIVHRIKGGSDNGMPAFEGALTNDQIKGIIHYIRGLDRH